MSPTRRGFTLLELLVVIMITGVITGLSMGRVSNILAHERIASASIRLSNELRQGFAIPGRLRRPVLPPPQGGRACFDGPPSSMAAFVQS